MVKQKHTLVKLMSAGWLCTLTNSALVSAVREVRLRSQLFSTMELSEKLGEGILPTPHFSTRFPPPSCLRRSGSSPRCSGLHQKASSTPVSRATSSTLGAHPLSLSPISFLPIPLPRCLHLLLRSLLSSRLFQFLLPHKNAGTTNPPRPKHQFFSLILRATKEKNRFWSH